MPTQFCAFLSVMLPSLIQRGRTRRVLDPSKVLGNRDNKVSTTSFVRASQTEKTNFESSVPKLLKVGAFLAVGGGLYLAFSQYSKKKARLEECSDLPISRWFKAKVELTLFRGCVVLKDLVKNGTIDKVLKFQMRPDDIIIASYPKSGTTWLQEVVYLLYHLDKEEPPELRASVMETKFPYIEYPYPGFRDLERRQSPRFLKTHLPVQLLPISARTARPKILYIYRNPKDVAVSYFHFAKSLVYLQFYGTFERFARLLIENKLPYSPYFPHLNDYLKLGQKFSDHVLVITYEDMKEDAEREIAKIASFLGIKVNEEQVKEVAIRTSFQAMKSNPRTNYEHWRELGLQVKSGDPFMRRGEVGNFHSYFVDKDLIRDFDEWIRRGSEGTGLNFKYGLNEQQR